MFAAFFLKIMYNFFLTTGKQKGTTSSTDSDSKMASSGLTEKQLQLSVEVWRNTFSFSMTSVDAC